MQSLEGNWMTGVVSKNGNSMSTYRWELVIEGSNDMTEWKEYQYKYKPSFPNKTPAVIPLHLPGLGELTCKVTLKIDSS